MNALASGHMSDYRSQYGIVERPERRCQPMLPGAAGFQYFIMRLSMRTTMQNSAIDSDDDSTIAA